VRRLDVQGFGRRILIVSLVVVATWGGAAAAQGQPEGQLTVAFDASIAPTFLDPAETPGIGTPFVFLYAMHDAMYGGIFEPATIHGIGPRVEEAGVGLSPQLYFTSPWEDMRLKKP
jgi:hypothetical protein